MQTVTVARLATYLGALREQGGAGTTIVLVDSEQIEAVRAFALSRVAKATGDWRVEIHTEDPEPFQGEARRRFEDGAYERDRIAGRERVVYITTKPFYAIPSVKSRLHWLDARDRVFPHPRAPRVAQSEPRRPSGSDTLWHQDEVFR